MRKNPDFKEDILEPIEIFALDKFADSAIIIKARTTTKPLKQWRIGREFNRRLKKKFDEEATTEDLLHFIEGFGLIKKIIHENSALVGASLLESKLSEKGFLVLGIERDKNWIPIPKSSEIIKQGDRLVVYGSLKDLKSLLEERDLSQA